MISAWSIYISTHGNLLQIWYRDILKWNDCIAEGTLDLGKPFYKAFKKKTEVLKLFESEITEADTGAMKSTMVRRQEDLTVDQASNNLSCHSTA